MRNRVKKSTCPNCGHQLTGDDNFCPSCGQENHTHKLPIKHFILELFESLFHFDTKFFRTIRDLFAKPGLLTKNYNENKRARYVPPFRLYIFTSVIYFFMAPLILSGPTSKIETGTVTQKDADTSPFNVSPELDTISDAIYIELSKKENLTDADIEAALKKYGKNINWFNKTDVRMGANFFKSNQKEFMDKAFDSIPNMMFFIMPVFALLLYLLYYRRGMFFSEHLVFSIHIHVLGFIALLAGLFIKKISGFSIPSVPVGMAVLLIYLPLFVKNVYGQNWGISILKTFLMIAGYLAIFITAFIIAMIANLV